MKAISSSCFLVTILSYVHGIPPSKTACSPPDDSRITWSDHDCNGNWIGITTGTYNYGDALKTCVDIGAKFIAIKLLKIAIVIPVLIKLSVI